MSDIAGVNVSWRRVSKQLNFACRSISLWRYATLRDRAKDKIVTVESLEHWLNFLIISDDSFCTNEVFKSIKSDFPKRHS